MIYLPDSRETRMDPKRETCFFSSESGQVNKVGSGGGGKCTKTCPCNVHRFLSYKKYF